MSEFYSLKALSIRGEPIDFSSFQGRVVLIVNVASQCGFTPQYEGLQTLYQDYANDGLVVLGVPCNQFGHQEPGDAAEIQNFCSTNYNISFPMLEKTDVNGEHAHPLYVWLKAQKPGILDTEAIKWNFTKFLVGRDGQVLDRFAPTTTPGALRGPIEAALQATA